MAPESVSEEAAPATNGLARQATRSTSEATVLCVFVLNIDALYQAGQSRVYLRLS